MHFHFMPRALALSVACIVAGQQLATAQSMWMGYGGNAQHTAQAAGGSQHLQKILWQTPVDTAPPYSGNVLYIHYGEPAISAQNTIIFPLRSSGNNFTIMGLNGATGSFVWSAPTSYTFPDYDWIPSFGPTLIPPPLSSTGRPMSPMVAWAESGGRVAFRSNADSHACTIVMHAFYGDGQYAANASGMDAGLKICTPLTAGPDGAVYFGVRVQGSNPLNVPSGLAVVYPSGRSAFVSVTDLSGGDTSIDRVQMNCAPAISTDGNTVYVAVSSGSESPGYLVSASTKTLKPIAHVALIDPYTNAGAKVMDDGTASPLIAPDGSVFMGVLESSWFTNDDRGYLLHFSGDLLNEFTPGAFGWDDTGSILPSRLFSEHYRTTSSYLVMTKYNNYADFSGDGHNLVALVDPNKTMVNADNGLTVMNVAASQIGQTPDPDFPNKPGAVREWCINSAAIDLVNRAIVVNSEDGVLYRWSLDSNTLAEKIRLTAGIGEAYTPTIIGPTGLVYAINNATLFCVGNATTP
jgi:hypothetical protein